MKGLVLAAALLGGSLGVGLGGAPGLAALASARLYACGGSQPLRQVQGYREKLVAGDGPVLLMLVGGQRQARISIAHSTPDKLGWRGQKTPWLVRKSYRGPIVVTARRIDGSGKARFARVYGQHLPKLTYVADDRNPPAHGYYGLPSTTLFRATGCYAFHVSGRDFGERLVIRVVA